MYKISLNRTSQMNLKNKKTTANELAKKGHLITCFNFGGSIVQAIEKIGNDISSYSDPRKGNVA
jgi:hypothetical protein